MIYTFGTVNTYGSAASIKSWQDKYKPHETVTSKTGPIKYILFAAYNSSMRVKWTELSTCAAIRPEGFDNM
jgi:hypothetical protein